MIKKLRLKFVLVFLILAVGAFTVSSCYASEIYSYVHDNTYNISIDNNIISFVNTTSGASFDLDCSYGFNNYSNYYIMSDFGDEWSSGYYFNILFSNSFKWSTSETLPSGYYGYVNIADLCLYRVRYMGGSFSFSSSYPVINPTNISFVDYGLVIDSNDNITYPNTSYNHSLIVSNHNIYGNSNKNLLLYQATVDTSFNYSLNGVKRGQVELKIEGLDSSLNMYGYVGVKNTFEIADVFVPGSLSDNLRLIGMLDYNSDLSCSLYEGEKLLYYIVDENSVILDIGYISEMAEGYFLYGFPVNDGVDFVFLKDGQVYWNGDLTFKYQVNGGSLSSYNTIVSIGVDSYISSDKTESNLIYNGFVYNSDEEVVASATTKTSNDLSAFSISVDTYYQEKGVFDKVSIYGIKRIDLEGTDFNGNLLDFTNYTIRWSVPTWLQVETISINGTETDKYNGILSGFYSFGSLYDVNLEIEEKIKNHIKNFDITFEVYDSNGDLATTYVINSDSIIQKQVASEENNIDKEDYEIVDNPSYTGGSGNKDFSNIQNWTEDDYMNLMSTDNFIWQFFKAILGNLPWWITIPMTILIFGVVIITLIRFARGA